MNSLPLILIIDACMFIVGEKLLVITKFFFPASEKIFFFSYFFFDWEFKGLNFIKSLILFFDVFSK